MTDRLADLRRRVDECDEMLVRWINERLRVCQEIGQVKEEHGLGVRYPEREQEVLERALGRNEGPCPPEVIEKVFRLFIETAVALEESQDRNRPKA